MCDREIQIVYTPGVWDILHPGHINVTKQAKLHGDYLIVGVCSDRLARVHGKNPVVSETDRAEIMSSLKWVDQTHIYDNPDQTEALKLFKPNTFVIGEDFGKQGVPEHAYALDYCVTGNIHVVRVNRHPGTSSTEVKAKINNMQKNAVIKKFWETRADLTNKNQIGLWQATSFTKDEQAEDRKNKDLNAIVHAINKSNNPKNLLLEVGCGVGRMAVELTDVFKEIHASDYLGDFIEIAKKNTKGKNIHFFQAEAHEFNKSIPYDYCLISGLLTYLTDEQVNKLLEAISYIPCIVLKESVGTFNHFELSNDHYSEELKSTYTGTYRTASEIISLFAARGYAPVYAEIVEKHRKETNLHIFLFEKSL